MSYEFKISDLKGIFRRRKKVLFVSFALIFLACLIVAMALPPVYESIATIYIENQQIPKEFVQATTASYISERLHALEQQILNYTSLLGIIREHSLYPELPSEGQMVSQMRDAIKIQTLDVYVPDARSKNVTVAFTLTYEHRDPQKTAEVANLLANLYVEQDRRTREAQASTTTDFLSRELEELRNQVRDYEEKISRFRAENIDRLPGSTGTLQQTTLRLEQDIERINTRLRTLQEQNVYLKSQIANVDPLIPIVTEEGKVAANPANRLKYLRLQLIQLQSQLSDRHPDVIRLKGEIADLAKQVGDKDTSMEKENRLNLLEKELIEVKSKYGDKHPDVVRLTREAELLKQQIAKQKSTPVSQIPEERADNPAYMNLRAQIIATEMEIESLRADRLRAQQRLEDYQRRLEVVPFIEEQFNALTLDYDNAKKKFDEVSRNLHTAKISQEMDASEHGERFRIHQQAWVPEMPSKPNRLLIILMGFVLGGGCAVLLAAVKEGLDSSIKGPDLVENVLGVPVLATISLYDSPRQKMQRRVKRVVVLTSAVAVIVLASLAVDRFVMPLDDLWTKVEGRLVEMGVPIKQESAKS